MCVWGTFNLNLLFNLIPTQTRLTQTSTAANANLRQKCTIPNNFDYCTSKCKALVLQHSKRHFWFYATWPALYKQASIHQIVDCLFLLHFQFAVWFASEIKLPLWNFISPATCKLWKCFVLVCVCGFVWVVNGKWNLQLEKRAFTYWIFCISNQFE